MTRKDILIQKAIDYVIKGDTWKQKDRGMLEIYFDKMYTEDEIEKMLIDVGVIKDITLEQYIRYNNLKYKTNMEYEEFKKLIGNRKKDSYELISMDFIESLSPTDEEIEELIKKYFKENK